MTSLLGAHVGGPKRVLDSSERIAEVLFGLIMVLTFTGSLSATEAGREGVRAMLIGALGCNIAWGIIVGVLYLMSAVGERGSILTVFRAVRGARDAAHAPRLISLSGSDWWGALVVSLLVFISTFPVTIPFIIMADATRAMRVSNAIAVAMMFMAGVAYGRAVGWSPWAVGLSMVALGSALVAMTIALGG